MELVFDYPQLSLISSEKSVCFWNHIGTLARLAEILLIFLLSNMHAVSRCIFTGQEDYNK